uniref:Uncharacterized protein n=1 Tax=Arundo donax TaxID=35708 RepID=A0A0A9G869_ARUDO
MDAPPPPPPPSSTRCDPARRQNCHGRSSTLHSAAAPSAPEMATAKACERRLRDQDTVTTRECPAILARYTDAVTALPGLCPFTGTSSTAAMMSHVDSAGCSPLLCMYDATWSCMATR